MSTRNPNLSLEHALSAIPASLRKRLLKTYADLKKRNLEGEFDAIGVRAGKLAEVLLRALQHLLTGQYTLLSGNLNNFKRECELLEATPIASGPDGLRILMPRAFVHVYAAQ